MKKYSVFINNLVFLFLTDYSFDVKIMKGERTVGGPIWTNMESNENEVVRESARTPSAEVITLHSDDPNYTEKAVANIGKALDRIRLQRGWTNAQLLQHLDTNFYKSPESISRIIDHNHKRLPNAAQVFELRRVFGADLNALADGDNPFVLEQMSDTCLADLLEQVSAEIVRRNRRKWQK